MSQKRFILGQKSPGVYGVFISPPGIDAGLALPNQLLLDTTRKVPQFILRGTAANGSVVSYGQIFSFIPIVLISTFTSQLGTGFGNVRPMGNVYYGAGVNSSAAGSTSNFSLSTPFGSVSYLVMNAG